MTGSGAPDSGRPDGDPAGRGAGGQAPESRARRVCRMGSWSCLPLALLLLIPLFFLPGSWPIALLLAVPALVGTVGIVLGIVARRAGLVVGNVLCGWLSVPVLFVVVTLVAGP